MAEFIVNPRRSPRAPVRCRARLALRQGGFVDSPTSDFGPKGCQLLTPVPLPAGSGIFLELENERVGRPVELCGRVAWVANGPPWRVGVAFDAGYVPAASRFFEALARAYPDLDSSARAPDRIAGDAPLAPAPPPDPAPALTPEEEDVLRALGSGLTAAALRERLGAAFERARNAIFALLGRRYVVVGEPNAAAALEWSVLLYLRTPAT